MAGKASPILIEGQELFCGKSATTNNTKVDGDDRRYRKLVGQGARIVHILHDEIIVEAREEIAGDVAVTVKACMERAFTEIFPDVLFVVTPEIRESWG